MVMDALLLLSLAPSVLGYQYPAIPSDLTTPVQQRIGVAGPNGKSAMLIVVGYFVLI